MAPDNTLQQDVRTMSMVGLAHGLSHFFHLLLPPLFPVFISDFGLSYGELGYLVSVFFVVSGLGQVGSGFLVDRIGARPVLFVALLCFAGSALAGASAQGYAGLVLSAVLAGAGNAPFHPVDFTILNKRVSAARLGHAFSVHGISGSLGWAAAPAFLASMTWVTGSWRGALLCAAGLVIAIGAVLIWQRDALNDQLAPAAPKAVGGTMTVEHPLAFLRLPVVWFCFSFFFWSTAALSAIQSFAVPALQSLIADRRPASQVLVGATPAPPAQAEVATSAQDRASGTGITPQSASPHPFLAFLLSGYMLCSAVGMVLGGALAPRAARLEKLIGLCLVVSAGALFVVGTGILPAAWAIGLVIVTGFGVGLAGPSRDMLIKRAAPAGATGRVYGLVYAGLDTGFALASPVFGHLLDRGWPQGVFWGAGLALGMAVLSATLVGARLKPHPVMVAAAASS